MFIQVKISVCFKKKKKKRKPSYDSRAAKSTVSLNARVSNAQMHRCTSYRMRDAHAAETRCTYFCASYANRFACLSYFDDDTV